MGAQQEAMIDELVSQANYNHQRLRDMVVLLDAADDITKRLAKENVILKQRVAELLAVCEEMSSSLDAAIFQFPRSVGKGRLVSAYTQMLAAIAPESEVT